MGFIREESIVFAVLFIVGRVGHVLAAGTPGDINGKMVIGYQGWFTAINDGSPRGTVENPKKWVHWSRNESLPPSPGNCKFDLYPDVRGYTQLYQTQLASLGNGQPANLFSSWSDQSVDLHFTWLQNNGIDTVALQRFGGNIQFPLALQQMNGIANKVRTASQNHGRKFFIQYDVSGWFTFVNQVMTDVNTYILPLTSSTAYARQNGKPVLCIWGFGVNDANRPDTPSQFITIINQLKQTFYVIGGVPTQWRSGTGNSKPGYWGVYSAFDMIQPWAVGTYGGIGGADSYRTNFLQPDFLNCTARNVDYQPVVFPGFSWSNWLPGTPNQIPRLNGTFFWRQCVNVKQVNIPAIYVAMFDEYDEGTAIAPAAENSQWIPTNQWFLTLNADGADLSSDFYLRLAKDANLMHKGQAQVSQTYPTPWRLNNNNGGNPNTNMLMQIMSAIANPMFSQLMSIMQNLFSSILAM